MKFVNVAKDVFLAESAIETIHVEGPTDGTPKGEKPLVIVKTVSGAVYTLHGGDYAKAIIALLEKSGRKVRASKPGALSLNILTNQDAVKFVES
jgi:hypothetical protein